MSETNEPRALAAALSGPVFTPRGRAMQVADRHVERWAPEATADRVRPLRNLGFADRVVSPLMETAQRSVSQLQRLFSPPTAEAEAGTRAGGGVANAAGITGGGSGQPDHVSWLFPRPSFQDELDWMAAARQPVRDSHQLGPLSLPVSLHDYIAPALSPTSGKAAVRAPFVRSLAGTPFEGSLGPRLVMPVGLGGLVAMVNHSLAVGGATKRGGLGGIGGFVGPGGWRAPTMSVPTLSVLMPSMTLISTIAHHYGKARPKASAFAAAEASVPAAIQHVAWSDRWLARFSGARDSSLDALGPTRSVAVAPELVLMAPRVEAAAAQVAKRVQQAPTIRRYDDDEATPDDVLTEIVTSAAGDIPSGRPLRARRPVMPMVRRDSVADVIAHAVPSAPDAGLSAQLAASPFAPAMRHVLPLAAAPVFDVRSLDGSGLSVAYLSGVLAPASGLVVAGAAGDAGTRISARETLDWSPTFVATASARGEVATDAREPREFSEPVTARSALLAPESRLISTGGARRGIADTLAHAIALPMLAESLDDSPGSLDVSGVHQRVAMFAAPGMVATRAHAWSVAQERSASDLALDFVPPELVLAARVYGLGPAEAGQAMRLAMAGPGQLTAMANAVDRTFVQVLQIEADRRDQVRQQRVEPTLVAASGAPSVAEYDDRGDATPPVSSSSAFGVDRRPPRGAFMWPAAAVSALGLAAAPPDGEQAMSVAALELLAASAVAQLGTYAVLGRSQRRPDQAESLLHDAASDRASGSAPAPGDLATDSSDRVAAAPATQRAAFEAMYLALAKPDVRRDAGSWSPAADAARALAFAGRIDSTTSAVERAQAAWGVLPLLALRPDRPDASDGGNMPHFADSSVRSRADISSGTAGRSAFGMPVVSGPSPLAPGSFEYPPVAYTERRPGLSQLSARAGEALTSYVTPVVVSAAATQEAEARAAAAAAEIMRPGRSAGRFGGGETEIPTWFEAAARKILAERGGGDGLSLAELTLVNAAPGQQIAAATEGETPAVAPAALTAKPEFSDADVQHLAESVLKTVKQMIEDANRRGGFYV